MELWMRFTVVSLLLSFAYFSRYLLSKQLKISRELEAYKNTLLKINSELKDEIKERKKAEEILEELAGTDHLSGLLNRRKFHEVLTTQIGKSRSSSLDPILVMCDIDNFKSINDQYGHTVGDKVISQFAQLIKDNVKESDVVARWGGEEFIILFPDTKIKKAFAAVEQLRALINKTDFGLSDELSASFGIAQFNDDENESELIDRTDKALYDAKRNGRNRIELAL